MDTPYSFEIKKKDAPEWLIENIAEALSKNRCRTTG